MATKKSSGVKKIVWTLIILAVIAGAAVPYYLGKREVVVEIQTDKVGRRNITEIIPANGRIQPYTQVVINPEVSGEIVALPVKDGQAVKKGDLLVKIKPDNYQAQLNSADASFKSSQANIALAKANLSKAELEFKRYSLLFKDKLISESQFLEYQTSLEVQKATYETSQHQGDQANASLARAKDDLSKTIIYSPIDGTVTKLKSQLGERVVGTAMMAGTEIMTVADLNVMEARVDIGESDVPLISIGQKAKLEVEAFKNRKFNGEVTEIANASRASMQTGGGGGGGGASQEATKFEVRIRIAEKEGFRPGMSVSAEVETRSRTNVLAVPVQSVTTRFLNSTNAAGKPAEKPAAPAPSQGPGKEKDKDRAKPSEIVFKMDGDKVKAVKVTTGISDDSHYEITEGLKEGDEIVSGGFKAISRDLEDGKKVKKGAGGPPKEQAK